MARNVGEFYVQQIVRYITHIAELSYKTFFQIAVGLMNFHIGSKDNIITII